MANVGGKMILNVYMAISLVLTLTNADVNKSDVFTHPQVMVLQSGENFKAQCIPPTKSVLLMVNDCPVQWFYENSRITYLSTLDLPITDQRSKRYSVDIFSNMSVSLFIKGVRLTDSGTYMCKSCGNITSITLTVIEKSPVIRLTTSEKLLYTDEDLVLTCHISGITTLEMVNRFPVQIFKGSKRLSYLLSVESNRKDQRIRVDFDSKKIDDFSIILTIQNLTIDDSGVYTCKSYNVSSTASVIVTERDVTDMNVIAKPSLTSVKENGVFEARCRVISTRPICINVNNIMEWYKGSSLIARQMMIDDDFQDKRLSLVMVKDNNNSIEVTLQIKNVTVADKGEYRCQLGSQSGSMRLKVIVPTSTPAPASLGPGRSDIACEADSITSFVPVDQLPVGTQLTWRDPACGLTSNGTHLLSTIGHNQCGTTVKITQNSVEFENELIAQSTKSTQSLVDFGDSSFVIPVKCIYPRQTQVATFYQPTQQHVRFYEKRYGHFDVDIVQYKTDKFVTPVQDLGIPRKVPIKSQIYVEAGINDQYSSSLGIHVDQCIATRTPSPSDSVYYSLIKDGCPIIPHVTLYNSTNSKVRFGVEAFRFVTANASDVVYIHCQVSVCDAATPHCAVNCMTSAGRRRRAAAGSGDKTHLLSTGPFMLVVDDQATSLSSSNLVAAISALVAVIACIVAIIGWTRRRHEAVTQPNKL